MINPNRVGERRRTTPGKARSGEGYVDSRIQVEGWRKMKAAAENRAEDGEEWCVDSRTQGETMILSSQIII